MIYEIRNSWKTLKTSLKIIKLSNISGDLKAQNDRLAKAYQADQALNVHKRRLEKFIQKNYPRIVSQLKARLFQDHQNVSQRLRVTQRRFEKNLKLNRK